jgi:alpha-tubulin suppressor-like RCC1 family protein
MFTRAPTYLVSMVVLLTACGESTAPDRPGAPSGVGLSVGGHHACRLTADGHALCWGRADAGQLGIGTTPLRSEPVQVVAGATRFTSVAAGGLHSCALTADGEAWCWGQNAAGQAGLSAALTQPCGEPIHGWQCVPGPHAVETTLRFDVLVAGGANTCGFARSGGIYCWGSNGAGQLGAAASDTCDGAPCSRTPVPLPSEPRLRTLALGSAAHFCGLTNTGAAYCWGSNSGGQLGIGTVGGTRDAPAAVSGGLSFKAIAVGGEHTCAVAADGAAWCWGRDILPAGAGGISFSAVPVAIGQSPAFTDLITGTWAACGRTAAGSVSCWGINAHGEIGTTPAGLNARYDTPQPLAGGTRWSLIAGSLATFCGLDDIGGTRCWGDGSSGELGTDLDATTLPVRVGGV